MKKSHFSLINNSIVLKWLMICPFWWAPMGMITLKDWSIMRMSLGLIDTAYNGSYFTIPLWQRAGQVLINNKVKYEDTYDLIRSTKSTRKVKRLYYLLKIVIIWKVNFIHSDIEELAKSLIEFSIKVRRFNLKKQQP